MNPHAIFLIGFALGACSVGALSCFIIWLAFHERSVRRQRFFDFFNAHTNYTGVGPTEPPSSIRPFIPTQKEKPGL